MKVHILEPKVVPKTSQDGSKTAPRSPKTAQDRPKTDPGPPQDRPRAPKSGPRAAQERSGATKERPRAAQQRPRPPQDRPKTRLKAILKPYYVFRGCWTRKSSETFIFNLFGAFFGNLSEQEREARYKCENCKTCLAVCILLTAFFHAIKLCTTLSNNHMQ